MLKIGSETQIVIKSSISVAEITYQIQKLHSCRFFMGKQGLSVNLKY